MQQDRLAALRQREVDCNGLLEIQERQELWALERAARKVEWARIPAQKTPEQRMIELLGLRWAAGSFGRCADAHATSSPGTNTRNALAAKAFEWKARAA